MLVGHLKPIERDGPQEMHKTCEAITQLQHARIFDPAALCRTLFPFVGFRVPWWQSVED